MIHVTIYTKGSALVGASFAAPGNTTITASITEEEAVRIVAELQVALAAKQRELEQALESEGA